MIELLEFVEKQTFLLRKRYSNLPCVSKIVYLEGMRAICLCICILCTYMVIPKGVFPILLYRKDNHVTNVKIYNKGMAYDVGGGLQFTCLSNLIEHYKKNPMSEMNGEVIQLSEVRNILN